MQKKLIVVSSYDYADTNATKARLRAYLDILQEEYQIIFICPEGSEILDIKNVLVVPSGRSPVHGKFFIRILREIIYAIKIIPKIWSNKPNIMIISIPSMFLMLLTLIKSSPVILDIRDLVWEYLPGDTKLARLIKSIVRRLMLFLVNRADVIFVTNEREKEYISNFTNETNTTVKVVRNGINEDRFRKLSNLSLRENKSNFKILYVGNIGYAQNLKILVEAMKLTRDVNATVVGVGNSFEDVKSYAAKLKVDNIEFVGGVKWNSLLSYYEDADVLYAQISDEYQSAVPSKLYEYLSVGLPVIYAGVGVSLEFMKQFNNVYVIPPNDPHKLSCIVTSIKDGGYRQLSSSNQKKIQSKYIRESQVIDILPEINRVLRS
jgi:glycosyltransferase involved in cell wall biosynthesis